MRLIIAEKPSQARAIADAIGIRGKGNGCIDAGEIVISWCVGHLVELSPPEEYDPALGKWTLDTLPFLPSMFKTQPSKGTLEQFKILKGLLSRKDLNDVICATDSGREGELIFDLVYRQCNCNKSVKRLWTASLTPEALRDAYANLRPASEFAGLRAAAHCRARADWLVGLNATRAQTLVAQQAGGEGIWPIGRVQTPTLAMIVEREKAIKNFVSKSFWQVNAHFQSSDGEYIGRWFHELDGQHVTHLESQQAAQEIASRVCGKPGRIALVQGTEERQKPEQLFDLTALQREANKRFAFSADKTLQTIQGLYERGILSYPRTNSRYLTEAEGATLPKILQNLPNEYSQFTSKLSSQNLGKRFIDATKVEDHHAIIPTGKTADMTHEERQIFDLVARRTIAAYFEDEITRKTIVITVVGEDRFRSIGRIIVNPGWTKVAMKLEEDSEENADRSLPPIAYGTAVQVKKSDSIAGKTQPPKPYTEADLLGAMETAGRALDDDAQREAMKDAGLGTPATRAAIIEGLLSRDLVVRKGKTLLPTPKGTALIEAIRSPLLKSPELTGEWEAKLEGVRKGNLSSERFMNEVREYTQRIVAEIKGTSLQNVTGVRRESITLPPCPKCHSGLVLKSWQGAYYVKCTATKNPECRVSYDCDSSGKPKGGLCKKCKGPMKITKSKAKVCVACDTWA